MQTLVRFEKVWKICFESLMFWFSGFKSLKIIPKIGVSGTKRICETLKKFFCIWFIKFPSSYKKLELKNKYWVKIWKMIFFQISKIFKFWPKIYFSSPNFCKRLWILYIICRNNILMFHKCPWCLKYQFWELFGNFWTLRIKISNFQNIFSKLL